MDLRQRNRLLVISALLIAVSGGVHLRLYREEYRDVHVDRVLGVDLSRSFVLSVVAATVLAVLLVLTVVRKRSGRLVVAGAFAYSVGALVAYALSRTVGLLGFEEDRWTTEALIAKPVETVAALLCGAALLASRGPVPAGDDRVRRTSNALRLSALALPVALVALVGLLATDSAPSAPASAAPSHGTVAIEGFAFAPATLRVKVGDEVVWRNDDGAAHTVEDGSGLFDESDDLGAGDTFAFAYAKAGTFAYFCGIHSYMQGEVIVE